MFCRTCFGQKQIVLPDRGPVTCPECYGLELSCCEGTDRELDHQPGVRGRVAPTHDATSHKPKNDIWYKVFGTVNSFGFSQVWELEAEVA